MFAKCSGVEPPMQKGNVGACSVYGFKAVTVWVTCYGTIDPSECRLWRHQYKRLRVKGSRTHLGAYVLFQERQYERQLANNRISLSQPRSINVVA
jgi:hypothetical protein